MSKPNMIFGGFKSKQEMDAVAEALLDALGKDTCITPGGDNNLLVTWGRVKPTEGGARGFVKGVLWGYRKGRETGYSTCFEAMQKEAPDDANMS
jgi:hypothetical protein